MSRRADEMARARREFAEANDRGCTIVELRRLKAKERHDAAVAKLEARRRCGSHASPISADRAPRAPFRAQDRRDEPWMMRE